MPTDEELVKQVLQAEISRLKAIVANYEEDLARAYSSALNQFHKMGFAYHEAVEKAKDIFKKV